MLAARHSTAIFVLFLSVSACGGAGSERVSVATPPATNPPPPIPATVTIFPKPLPSQEFAVASPGDAAVRIRYDAGRNAYQLQLPDRGWEDLVSYPADPDRIYFAGPFGSFERRVSSSSPEAETRYLYSSLAYWRYGSGSAVAREGAIAFGMATPAQSVPTTGTARYDGLIAGATDLTLVTDWGPFNVGVNGTARFDFDFAAGRLSGELRPVYDGIDRPSEALAFADTVFSAGSANFSGRFATNVAGENRFSGLFTGPAAQELIGSFAFPFAHDGGVYTASGALIAKRD